MNEHYAQVVFTRQELGYTITAVTNALNRATKNRTGDYEVRGLEIVRDRLVQVRAERGWTR